jgi:hypothetical protein
LPVVSFIPVSTCYCGTFTSPTSTSTFTTNDVFFLWKHFL